MPIDNLDVLGGHAGGLEVSGSSAALIPLPEAIAGVEFGGTGEGPEAEFTQGAFGIYLGGTAQPV